MKLGDRDLYNIESGLVREYNSLLDKRRKLRPSVRAISMVGVKRTLEKVRDEMKDRGLIDAGTTVGTQDAADGRDGDGEGDRQETGSTGSSS